MAAARELLTAYISLELLSFCLYVLVVVREVRPALERGRAEVHAAGRVLVGDLPLRHQPDLRRHRHDALRGDRRGARAATSADIELALLLGLVLIIGGLGFKVAAVPFHMWTPDAYEGAPLPITAFISAISKAAGVRAVPEALRAGVPADDRRLAVLHRRRSSVATMALGNLVAHPAAQHQAAAGVLEHRPGGLHADGHRGALAGLGERAGAAHDRAT